MNTINFTRGVPANESFPTAELTDAATAVFQSHGNQMLQYGPSRGFEPLRLLPNGKRVVLGIVTTKSGALESKEQLKRRIEEAARYAPLDQLCISGQCGFASTEEGNLLTEEEQWAKLRRIVEVADEVWG